MPMQMFSNVNQLRELDQKNIKSNKNQIVEEEDPRYSIVILDLSTTMEIYQVK